MICNTFLYSSDSNLTTKVDINSVSKIEEKSSLDTIFEKRDNNIYSKNRVQVIKDKELEEFTKEAQRYQKKVMREWIVLIIMGVAGIGGFILVFINIIKIKKMQDEIEERQYKLMKDIKESEKYV